MYTHDGRSVVRIDTGLLTNPHLTSAAKGVFGLIATMPPGQPLTVDRIASFGTDGRASVDRAVRELEDAGYLARVQTRDADGRMGAAAYTLRADLVGPSDTAPIRDIPAARALPASGWAYAVTDGTPGRIKIGCAQNVQTRLRTLQSAHHARLRMVWQAPGGRSLEAHLHAALADHRLRGEWFDLTGLDAVAELDAAAALWAEARA